MSTNNTIPDSVGKAIAFLALGIVAGLTLDICAKWLLETYSLEQFVFLRSIFGVSFLLLTVSQFGGFASLRTSKWSWHLLRTLLASGAMFGFFYALSKIPLVNALTLAFTAPLMVTALSQPLLGERVGWRRWVAVVVGFAGVLIVLRPGAGVFTLAAAGVIVAAFCYACLAITARVLSSTESSFSLSVYVIVGPMVLSGLLLLRGNWQPLEAADWGLMALAGLCSAVAWIGIVGAYRRASPSLLAPFEYTALIGGAWAGYVIWNEVPDEGVIIGGLVIIASGLFVVYRELGSVRSSRYLRAMIAGGVARRLSRRRSRNQGQ